MTELMTAIAAFVLAGFLLAPSKKELRRTRAHNTTDLARCTEDLAGHIRSCTNEEQLETARRLLERFKEWYGDDFQGAKDYDALCVIYNQTKARLERTRRYGLEGNLSSEQLNIDDYPTIYRYENYKN